MFASNLIHKIIFKNICVFALYSPLCIICFQRVMIDTMNIWWTDKQNGSGRCKGCWQSRGCFQYVFFYLSFYISYLVPKPVDIHYLFHLFFFLYSIFFFVFWQIRKNWFQNRNGSLCELCIQGAICETRVRILVFVCFFFSSV